MPTISQDTAMGAGIITLCVMLLFRDRWILEQTRKGRRLVEWCGPVRAPWVLRAVLLVGITFGGLLAGGVIRPIQW